MFRCGVFVVVALLVLQITANTEKTKKPKHRLTKENCVKNFDNLSKLTEEVLEPIKAPFKHLYDGKKELVENATIKFNKDVIANCRSCHDHVIPSNRHAFEVAYADCGGKIENIKREHPKFPPYTENASLSKDENREKYCEHHIKYIEDLIGLYKKQLEVLKECHVLKNMKKYFVEKWQNCLYRNETTVP